MINAFFNKQSAYFQHFLYIQTYSTYFMRNTRRRAVAMKFFKMKLYSLRIQLKYVILWKTFFFVCRSLCHLFHMCQCILQHHVYNFFRLISFDINTDRNILSLVTCKKNVCTSNTLVLSAMHSSKKKKQYSSWKLNDSAQVYSSIFLVERILIGN